MKPLRLARQTGTPDSDLPEQPFESVMMNGGSCVWMEDRLQASC